MLTTVRPSGQEWEGEGGGEGWRVLQGAVRTAGHLHPELPSPSADRGPRPSTTAPAPRPTRTSTTREAEPETSPPRVRQLAGSRRLAVVGAPACIYESAKVTAVAGRHSTEAHNKRLAPLWVRGWCIRVQDQGWRSPLGLTPGRLSAHATSD